MEKIRGGPKNLFRLFLIEMLLPGPLKGSMALDAGCGDGSVAIRLAKKGYEVCAVDEDARSCDIAQTRVAQLHLTPRIRLIHDSLSRVVFPAGYFDTIVCSEVLEHLDDDRQILRKFNTLLKKGGVLVMSVPLQGKGWDIWDTMCGHKRLYSFDSLQQLLRESGFMIEKSFFWGYPFGKWYHQFFFLPWARKSGGEEEIRQERLLLTSIGKNKILSIVVGWFFLLDILFTPRKLAVGVVIKARTR